MRSTEMTIRAVTIRCNNKILTPRPDCDQSFRARFQIDKIGRQVFCAGEVLALVLGALSKITVGGDYEGRRRRRWARRFSTSAISPSGVLLQSSSLGGGGLLESAGVLDAVVSRISRFWGASCNRFKNAA